MCYIVYIIKIILYVRLKIWKWCFCLVWVIFYECVWGVSIVDGVKYFFFYLNIKFKFFYVWLKFFLYYFCGIVRMCLENVIKLFLGSFFGRNIWLCLFVLCDIVNWMINWFWYLWRIGIDLERERFLFFEILCNVN